MRSENVELCDSVRELIDLMHQKTTSDSIGVQTVLEEDGLPLTPSYLLPKKNSKKKRTTFGRRFHKYVGSRTLKHRRPSTNV